MQDRYAGDIGDFGKFALLKELENQGLSVGVNWYKISPPDFEKNPDGSFKQNDGKHIDFPDDLIKCDPDLASELIRISQGQVVPRNLKSLQNTHLLKDDAYYDASITVKDRVLWHQNALAYFEGRQSELVFLDPDNGLLVKSVGKGSKRSVKYVFYEEVLDYIDRRKSVLIYNHRSRKPELPYFREIEERMQKEISKSELKQKLEYEPEILEITFPRFSIRDYIAVTACQEHAKKIRKAFDAMWTGVWADNKMCQKPLTMDITYTEYRARFPKDSKDTFLKYYQALPEEVMIEMVGRMKANTTCKACAAGLWYQNRP